MSGFVLRDYQEISVQKGVDFFNGKSKKNAVIVLPTGSGKSLVIANIAKRLKGKTIIFQPSKELLEQNHAKYSSYGEFAEIYSASMGRKAISKVTFATIGSVYKKPEIFDEFDNCIVDECHLVSPEEGTMYKIFFAGLKLKILGLTATPIRTKRYNFPVKHSKICMLDRMRPKVFGEYLHITQISDMKANGYFSDVEYIKFDIDRSTLSINSTGADYTEVSIERFMEKNDVVGGAAKAYDDICKKGVAKHILVFIHSINAAFSLQKRIGINNCEVVTGTTKKSERKEILDKFRGKKINCVINVGVLTTGFDFPELDCIIMARPTMSLSLYYQIIGRCVRPHPNKEKAYVFDFVGNFERFGRVEDLKIEAIDGKYVIHNGIHILTNVDITETQNNQGGDVPTIDFGKYKGQRLDKIPNGYLKWLYENIRREKYNEHIFSYIEKNNLVKNT